MSKYVIMLGPHPQAQGGMASVIKAYGDGGLFDRWPILFLATASEGSRLRKLAAGMYSLMRFVVMLLAGRVAAVHMHVAQRRSFLRKALFFFIGALFARPVIFHLHGSQFDVYYERGSSPIVRWLIRAVLDRSRHVVVLSESWRQWIRGVTRNPNVTILPNPIVVRPLGTALPAPESESTILFLGRLGQRKGVYDLLEAIAKLVPRHRRLVLLCAGDGEIEEVKLRSRQLGIAAHVRVLGWVSGSDKERLFVQSCLCVLPSYGEGLPVAILEAMAAGLPIVASNVGGIPEAVAHDSEGLLFDPGDVSALTAALERLLTDSSLRRRLSLSARKKVLEKFAAEQVFEQLGQIYRGVGVVPRTIESGVIDASGATSAQL